MISIEQVLFPQLEELTSKNLRRSLRILETPQGAEGVIDGRRVINFSSNDYLGLAAEGFLCEAFAEAVKRYGVGAGGSRLISGTQTAHLALENALASFKKTEAALAFSCGYTTALGTIPALVGKNDIIVLDKLSHACLVDAAKLSGATLRIFPHNDLVKLDAHLHWARNKFPQAKILVITESVFSMDGDLAPLREIVEIKERYGAWLLVDEAHGVGVIGEEGRGWIEALGLGGRVEIQMGTLGKALGTAGGYIAGSRILIDWLINRARSFIFSTAPPAAVAVAATAALEWVQTSAGKERIHCLHKNLATLFQLCPKVLETLPRSAIVPIMAGDEAKALELAKDFLNHGLFVPAVRFPTVPKGSARLRLTLSALHRQEHLELVAKRING